MRKPITITNLFRCIIFFRQEIIITLLLLPPTTYAELWQGAKALPKGTSSYGLHAQFIQVPNSSSARFMTFGQFDYGKTDQLQIETRLGFGNLNYTIAVLAKYQIHSGQSWQLAVMGGLQLQNYVSLTGDFIGSTRWGPLECYNSLHFFVPLQGNAIGVGLIPGIDFQLNQWMFIYLEADLNLVGFYTAGSIGFRHFF